MTTPAAAATLQVEVTGVRNGHGLVRVAVCTEAEFLKECAHVGQVQAVAGSVIVRVEGIKPGIWAVQAFHDENANGKIDLNFLGIPTEGLGFSNDARFMFGPPRFGDAAIRLSGGGGRISLPLRYTF